MKAVYAVLILLFFNLTITAYAASLTNFLNSQGIANNVNSAKLLQLQQSGYLSGGSIILRGKRVPAQQILHITPPSISIDPCSMSMDLFGGGFSFIKNGDIMKTMKSATTIAGLYVAKQFLLNQCPSCHTVIEKIQDISAQVNNLTLDQCAMGKAMGGFLMDKIEASNKLDKAKINHLKGNASDNFDAWTKEGQGSPPTNFHKFPPRYNLVWYLLTKEYPDYSRVEKEFIISLIGTFIINKKETTQAEYQYKKSLFDESFLQKLLMPSINPGEKTEHPKIYQCVLNNTSDIHSDCLQMSEKQIDKTTLDKVFYINDIRNILLKLSTLIKDGTNITDNTRYPKILSLLNNTTLPLIPFIVTEYQLKPNQSSHLYLTSDFLELLAMDIVTTQLITILDKINNLGLSSGVDINDQRIQNLQKEIKLKLNAIHQYKSLSLKKSNHLLIVQSYILNRKKKFSHDIAKTFQ